MNREFALTDEHEKLREGVRAFTEERIKPEIERYRESGEFPHDVLDSIADAGYYGYPYPEQYGGTGEELDARAMAVIQEELSRVWKYPAGVLNVSWALVGNPIYEQGTERQREEWLTGLLTGELLGALSMTEPDAGSDVTRATTTAERDGDEWVIDGHKRWVTNFFDADYVLTYAKTGPDADAPRNVSAFLVPSDEFEVDHVWDTLGARALKSPRVTLSNVRVPDERRVGEVGSAAIERGTVYNGVNVPARAVGIARAALEDTIEYTADREQFGRSVGDFQGVRWRVAEMAGNVDVARLLTLRAADLADRGGDSKRELAMAKIDATETAVEVTNEALQLHGGVGYTASKDIERYLRDARLLTIAGGPNELHRNTLADAVYGEK